MHIELHRAGLARARNAQSSSLRGGVQDGVKAQMSRGGGTQPRRRRGRVGTSPPFADRRSSPSSCPEVPDASSRPLATPGTFPLKVATGAMPPLAKFAASPFGVVERLAEPGTPAMMPVTVRRVEPQLMVQALTPGKVSDMNPKTDAEIIAWFRKVRRYDNYTVSREQARKDIKGALPPVIDKDDAQHERAWSRCSRARRRQIAGHAWPRATHAFSRWSASRSRRASMCWRSHREARRRTARRARYARRAMYVRTALATNLPCTSLGHENSLAW